MTSVFVGATYYDYSEGLEYVALPFPDPKTLGDEVFAVVFWDNANKRYEYWAFSPFAEGEKDYTCNFSTTNILFYIQSSNAALHMNSYRMWFYPESSTYSISCYQIMESDGIFEYRGPSGVSCDVTRLVSYGDVNLSGTNPINSQVAYTFNNEISPYVFKQMSSDLGEIKFYCGEILEALENGSDYTAPETTVNSAVNDYNQAEQELMENQFSNIDGVVDVLPDFKDGKNHSAIQFLSSNMNFVAGASSYGSSEYQSTMSKLYSVFIIVLGLGFTSFIIGLVNRRKE